MKIKLTDIDAQLRETPSLTGNANKVLTVSSDGTTIEWKTPESGSASYPAFAGQAGRVLKVNSGENGVEWALDAGITDAPSNSRSYVRYNGSWNELVFPSGQISVSSRNDNYTLTLADAQSYIRFTSEFQQICTIPSNASVAFPIGTQISIRQAGIGVALISGASGVTVSYSADFLPQTRTVSSSIALIKVGTNEWDLMGDLELA